MLGHHNWTVPIMISLLCLEQTKIKVELKTDLISTIYIHRGYYTVARRYDFYFRVAKQYFSNERSE